MSESPQQKLCNGAFSEILQWNLPVGERLSVTGFLLSWSIVMSRTGWSPGTVPYGADQTVYLVVDRFSSGSVYRETELERADPETVIDDFLTGQFNDPVRVVAFNTLEHWANDVSKDIAEVIQARCDIAGDPVPEHVRDFVESYAPTTRQSALRQI